MTADHLRLIQIQLLSIRRLNVSVILQLELRQCWLVAFLHMKTSGWLPVSQSIIQGSGIGPYLYLLYASDLRTLPPHNVIVKYADNTTLLVGQYSSVDIAQEYENMMVFQKQTHYQY